MTMVVNLPFVVKFWLAVHGTCEHIPFVKPHLPHLSILSSDPRIPLHPIGCNTLFTIYAYYFIMLAKVTYNTCSIHTNTTSWARGSIYSYTLFYRFLNRWCACQFAGITYVNKWYQLFSISFTLFTSKVNIIIWTLLWLQLSRLCINYFNMTI